MVDCNVETHDPASKRFLATKCHCVVMFTSKLPPAEMANCRIRTLQMLKQKT